MDVYQSVPNVSVTGYNLVNRPIDQTELSSIAMAKDCIDAEYVPTTGKPSGLKWIMVGLAIALILVFFIFLFVFYLIGNSPPTHQLAILNSSSEPINLLVGTENGDTLLSLPLARLNPGQTLNYQATPASYVVIQGYYDDTLQSGSAEAIRDQQVSLGASYPYPLTKVKLWLAGSGYNGKTQIRDGSNILDVPNSNTSPIDLYGVSMQDGYNIELTIASTQFNNRDPQDPSSCAGPVWNSGISGGVCPGCCPPELQYINDNEYQACMSPCFALSDTPTGPQYCCTNSGACDNICESSWLDYWRIFFDACPTCMITNCDQPEFHCTSSGGLTSYLITFSPNG